MRINWFKDENHLVYINGATQLAELERTLHFPGLEEAANELRQHPTAEGFTIKGPKRTSGRLFVAKSCSRVENNSASVAPAARFHSLPKGNPIPDRRIAPV